MNSVLDVRHFPTTGSFFFLFINFLSLESSSDSFDELVVGVTDCGVKLELAQRLVQSNPTGCVASLDWSQTLVPTPRVGHPITKDLDQQGDVH